VTDRSDGLPLLTYASMVWRRRMLVLVIAGVMAVPAYAVSALFIQRRVVGVGGLELAAASVLWGFVALLPFALADLPHDVGWKPLGAVIVLGKRSITDLPTIAIMAVTLLVLWKLKKIPEPAVVAVAALAGLIVYQR